MVKGIKILLMFGFLTILSFISLVAGKNFNVPIYIQTSAGIERANSGVIEDILLNYNFETQIMQGYVPDERCSIRAGVGSLEIDGVIFSRNDLNFHIPLKNDGPGNGYLTGQKDDRRFSLDFEVLEILETNSKKLVFLASGEGLLDRKEINFNNITVTFDKVNNKVGIVGSGDKSFNAKDMDVSFREWCGGEIIDYYLIVMKDKLRHHRTEEEVDEELEEHPELVDMYEGLRSLNIALIPEFGVIVGALTLIGAIGLFFIVRQR
jgi:hypothetical protein